jgi:hypothetical protein
MRLIVLCVLAACILCTVTAHGGSARLEPTADNTLFEDANGDTSSGAGPALFAGKNNQNPGRARRALISFDLASAVPMGAIVDSVTLELHVSNASDLLPRVMTVHRVISAWGEGQSISEGGSGVDATPGDASWTCAFFPDHPWRQTGGDFETNPSAWRDVGGVGSCVWSGPGLVADVHSWLGRPSENFGWLILGDESGPGTARRFDSREHADPVLRPSLTVHFSLPGPARLATWGRLKSAYR